MLHRTEELYGKPIHATDGYIGSVHDIFFDDQEWAVRYVVVDTGPWLFGRLVLLSPHSITKIDEDGPLAISVDLTKQQVKDSPDVNLHEPVSPQQLADLNRYYGWPEFWAGSPLLGIGTAGSYPVMVATAEALAAEDAAAKEGVPTADPHLRSSKEVADYLVKASDGEVGHIDDLVFDAESLVFRYLVVDTGAWLPGKRVLIPVRLIERLNWRESTAYVSTTRARVRASPAYARDSTITREVETSLFQHYGMLPYWKEAAPPPP